MKKKLFEKDIFYLSLFLCICIIAIGGILFADKSLDKLASNENLNNKNNEINLIKKEKDKDTDKVPTSTKSKENLEKAKENYSKDSTSKLSYIGKKVIRSYSENTPSYSKTLDVWEVHKALDVLAESGYRVKSLLDGEVKAISSDDMYGSIIEMSYPDNLVVKFSGVKQEESLKVGDKVKQGQYIGYVTNNIKVESEDGPHVHIEAYKDKKAINPLSLLE